MDIHIIIHHGTLHGITIHIGEVRDTDIMVDITEDTTEIIMAIVIMTIMDHKEEYITEEVIQYQEITGQVDLCQIQGLLHRRESHVT